jgi:tyrosyl-tRNA synthetase
VPQGAIDASSFNDGVSISDALVKSGFLPSNSEARRALQEGSVSVNKNKASADSTISSNQLLNGKFVLLQRGKKNYFILRAE